MSRSKKTSPAYNCARGQMRYLIKEKGYSREEAAETVRESTWSNNW
jgi:hypothetical protein